MSIVALWATCFFFWRGWGVGLGGLSQGGCELRSEAFVKIKKKKKKWGKGVGLGGGGNQGGCECRNKAFV